MKICSIMDENFLEYGKVLTGIDTAELVETMHGLPVPDDVVYVPSEPELEKLDVVKALKDAVYGCLEIQAGYCNGHNHKLNALEYHYSSEINIAAEDMILLLGKRWDIAEDHTYDTSMLEAFLVPKGMAVELYATTLHYAPCSVGEKGFLCTIILPKGTNESLEDKTVIQKSPLLAAKNKWLIGHEDGNLPEGSFIGLKGKNIEI